ncbi:UNVERIFIED_CONTAM: putative galacturonosyltransferase 10 [Sesamum radiatum]|uniref:Hexosyltransferase n=1 Tax=Sesamum radiatum TaxID=300843 RepID=A0AAW2U9Y3_SESRA
MRRRGSDFRRPVRRRIPNVFWLTLCGSVILLFIVLLSRENQRPSSRSVYSKRFTRHEKVIEGLNITEEMVSPDSVTRQLNDQISLAKAFLVIAKESNNLQFAWELSAQIRNSQILLSNAALRRTPLTTSESETAIRDMALLLFQAQQLHYDSATMIMRLKAKIQVVVNSTALNSKNPEKVIFHLVTDEVNHAAMRAWFTMNSFAGVTVDVQKIEDFSWLNASYVPVLKQLQDSDTRSYYFSGSGGDNRTPIKFRNPKYLSMLNHLRFYIPEVFPALKKVVFLDDDVVVQKDLSALFSLDLNGNVNGAVETCMETFHRYHKYLNYSHPLIREHFDPDACGWAFGMNVFDLVEWRRRNVTGIYHYWQEKNVDRTLWKLGTLPPGLLTFYGLTEPLNPSWHVLGLGYTNVDPKLIETGAVLHFNGNSKLG